MKKSVLIIFGLLALVFFANKANAQYYFYNDSYYETPLTFELGVSNGIMNCLTDVGGRAGLGKPFLKDLNMGVSQYNAGVYFSATFKDAVALRVEGTWGNIKAYDSILNNVQSSTNGRYERNLNFQSKISEISLITEFHPLYMFVNWEYRDQDPPRFSPYFIAGVGFFTFNPQTKNRDGKLVDLQPLSTEGQGFRSYPDRLPYKLSQINYPLGLGFRYELSDAFNIRAEVIHRTTTTDYLDDISTRYIDPTLFASEGGLTGNQLRDALDLYMNNRHNPGGSTGEFRKTSGGIRGNPRDNDAYFTFNFKIGYVFGRQAR